MTYAKRRWFTAEDDAEMLRGIEAGASLNEIAMSLDRKRGSVQNRARLIQGLRSTSPYVSLNPPKVNDLSGEVLCLGWCGKRFLSPDRLRIRVCFYCKKVQREGLVHTVEYKIVGI
jgi:hypothetical protein